MKRCKKITGWTDYPFKSLGDKAGEEAPIRHVRVLRYDGNKYVTVQTDCGALEWFKSGYLYGNCARIGKGAKVVSTRKLERMLPTRFNESTT